MSSFLSLEEAGHLGFTKSDQSCSPLQYQAIEIRKLQRRLKIAKTFIAVLALALIANLVLMYGHPTLATTFKDSFCGVPEGSQLMGVEEIQIIHASGKELSIRSPGEVRELQDRTPYLWWSLGTKALWVPAQAIAFWNMVTACQDFSAGGAPQQINCVWGALATAYTAAGVVYTTAVQVGKFATWINDNGWQIGGYSLGGWKRDDASDILEGLSRMFNSTVTHAGVFDYAHLGLGGFLAERNSTQPLDVFTFQKESGLQMHFSYLGGNNVNGKRKYPFKFGFGNGTVTKKIKGRDESFNDQWFSSGGLDFIIDQNPSDGGQLSTIYDYGQMDHQVSCYMSYNFNDYMYGAGAYFQIYDNNHQGTIAAGSIAPFRGSDHWSAIPQMWNIPYPIPENSACLVA